MDFCLEIYVNNVVLALEGLQGLRETGITMDDLGSHGLCRKVVLKLLSSWLQFGRRDASRFCQLILKLCKFTL